MGVRLGLGLTRQRGQVAGGSTAPAAFTAGQWSVADAATSGQAVVTITALPANGGSAITALQYSLAGGAWTAFSGSTTGSYTIGGFTNGVATNVTIRAVNAVGSGAVSDTKQVTTSAVSTAPAAFTAGQWSVADAATGGQAVVTITALPANGGSAITALQYSVAGGAWTAFSGSTTGSYTIGGFTNGVATNVTIRAVNAIGSGSTSDTKQVTTSAAATAPAAFTAGQWSGADAATGGQAVVTITALPANGGSAITALQYSLAGGAWTAFSGSTTGAYTIGGFTNGVATNVNLRAVNAIGSAAGSDTKQVTTSAGMSAPAAFTAGLWAVVSAGAGQATFNILTLPANGGSAITALQYRIGAGAWTAFGAATTGSYTVGGFTDGVSTGVLVRAVNAIGSGADSDGKSVTTGVTVSNQTATYGTKTVQNGGCFRPLNSLGQPVNLTAAPAPVLVSGGLGAYVPTITTTGPGTGLTFNSGGAGAPNGAVVRVALAGGGTVDLTIATEVNRFDVASLQQASTAYGSAVLGDKIVLRAGDHNITPTAPVTIARASSPAGTWTGGSDLTVGNWVTLTRDPGHPVRIGAVEVGGFNGHARYLRIDDLTFHSPLTANENGGIPGVASAQLSLYSSFSSTATMAVTNCQFGHASPVTGATIAYSGVNTGPLVAISCTGGPFWIEGNTINGCHTGINANSYNSTGAPPIIRRNTIRRAQIDVMLIGQCTGLLLEGNVVTDKLWPHTPMTVTGVTIGNPTVFTVADTAQAFTGDIVVLTGFTGAFAALNGRAELLSAKTATTLSFNYNSTGLTWDGLGGVVRCPTLNHGDYIQFSENNGATANQINVQIRGNLITRGQADGHWMPDGQGFFGGMGGTTADRTGWLIEGNIVECTLQRGISIGKLKNSTVRSNTIVRPLGLDGGSGGSSPAIIIEGGANNIYRDNLANGFSLGTSAAEDTANVVLSITSTESIPAFAANIAAYQGAFAAPPTAPDSVYDAKVALATRTSGGTFAGPIYPGATPYFNYTTLTYTDPRA